jgi:hypothetical protein
VAAARVEDGNDPAWAQTSASSGQSIVLRADRFWHQALQNPKPKEKCMGIKVNIWQKFTGNI